MRVLLLTLCALVFFGLGADARAQSGDVRALYDRLDRLERDVQSLQSQLARGGSSSLVVTSPAANPQAAGGANGAYASDRLDQLEDAVRDLTGKIEESNHKSVVTQRQLDRLQTDIDLRFKDIQAQLSPTPPPVDTGVEVPPAAVLPGAVADVKKTAGVPTPPNNSAEAPGLAPGPQVLGTISAKDIKKGADTTAAAPAAVAAAPKDAKAAYDAAYAQFQARDYAGAAQSFKAFIAKYPDHQFVSSATFWMGEGAYAQNDFRTSASLFGEGYRKFPDSTKAPDMLFKLGMSFAQLNMTKEACRSFKLLSENHPDMQDRLRKAASAERTKLGC